MPRGTLLHAWHAVRKKMEVAAHPLTGNGHLWPRGKTAPSYGDAGGWLVTEQIRKMGAIVHGGHRP